MDMLSILIPIYNYDCSALLRQIDEQCQALCISYEVVLGDDASSVDYQALYQAYTQEYPYLRLWQTDANMGASLVRQALVQEARGTTLLFLDSDITLSPLMLHKYLNARKQHPQAIVCGGFTYDIADCRQDNQLRYNYGMQVEVRPLAQRLAEPYQSFVAMGFLSLKEHLQKCPFPMMGMGYEDAYWGEALREAGISLIHIDAPVIHRLKERDDEFIQTTQRYIRNLYRYRRAFEGKRIRLLTLHACLKCFCLVRPLGLAFRYLDTPIRKILQHTPNALWLFQTYKLLYLCHLDSQQAD